MSNPNNPEIFNSIVSGIQAELPTEEYFDHHLQWRQSYYHFLFEHINPDSALASIAMEVKDNHDKAQQEFRKRAEEANDGIEYEDGEREELSYAQESASNLKEIFKDIYQEIVHEMKRPSAEDGSNLPFEDCVSNACKVQLVDIRTGSVSRFCTDVEKTEQERLVHQLEYFYLQESALHFQNLHRQ